MISITKFSTEMTKGESLQIKTGYETIEVVFQGMKADNTARLDICAPISIKIEKKKQPRKRLVFIQE